MRLYNTLGRNIEDLDLPSKKARIYSCGPTVYNYPHIGNMRAYIFADTLQRALRFKGNTVEHLINITDVGHLVSDGDDGADKVEETAKKEGKTAQEIADTYTQIFFEELERLHIDKKNFKFPKASEHIVEQIALIQRLEEKRVAYVISDGVYFDTSTFPSYGDLAELNIKGQEEGARVAPNKEKKNPSDFALWKFSKGVSRLQEWDSPWGVGFPGWHIECSAMAMKYLGETLDIHTGGIDHIPVHHTNEIAQSESATGKQFSRFWMHSGFLLVDGEKMSKSKNNFYRLDDIVAKGISPLSYRYWLLTADYKKTLNFTWEAVSGAQTALEKLYAFASQEEKENGVIDQSYLEQFTYYIENDLDTPKAIALIWEMIKSKELRDADKVKTLYKMDEVLGLNIEGVAHAYAPKEILALLQEREIYRKQKNWDKSDELRKEIEKNGYTVEDSMDGARVRRISP